MPGEYDLQSIFEAMEDDILASYRRNLARHTAEEIKEGFQWPMWQLLKFQDLKHFEKDVAALLKKYGKRSDAVGVQEIIREFKLGARGAEKLAGDLGVDLSDIGEESFFRANERQLAALELAIRNDLTTAERSVLRMSGDVFRKTIFKAEMFYTSGTRTLWQAVDLASKDFLDRGLNCVEYKNGARINVASYAEMCLRTSKKKAYMVGEGRRAADLGTTLCQVTQYSACSPTCLPWQGRVYVDDVYAGGQSDGIRPLLSEAIAGGLFHPNCRHGKQPYFEGISETPPSIDESEINENYEADQRQREIERNIRKFKRRATGSLDPGNRRQALAKVTSWQEEMLRHLEKNPQLRRDYAREEFSDLGRNPLYKSA